MKYRPRQTGKRKDLALDRKRRAKKPGRRVSKNGNVYYENRRNRSDVKGLDSPPSKRTVKRNYRKRKAATKKPFIASFGFKFG